MTSTSQFATTVVGTASVAPHADPTTLATAVSVATPIATSYPLLGVTRRDTEVVDVATPTIVEETARSTSTDPTTIIVDKDENWEAEYLKAMEEAEEMKRKSMLGKQKRCGGDGKMAKRCDPCLR